MSPSRSLLQTALQACGTAVFVSAFLVPSGHTQDKIFEVLGTESLGLMGLAASNAGDVEGDGWPDIITSGAYVSLISGRTQSVTLELLAPAYADGFGDSVDGIHDLDGDGYGELIVGGPNSTDFGGNVTGAAWVFSGFDGSILYTFFGDTEGDEFGFAVANVGDVNGDRYADIAVGAPQHPVELSPGYVRIFSGRTGSPIRTLSGTAVNQDFGYSVSGASYLDGDSHAEIVVGAPGEDFDRGAAYVFRGDGGGLWDAWVGLHAGSRFGYSVSDAGDVDGDGADDVIIGAPAEGTAGENSYAAVGSGLGGFIHILEGARGDIFFGASVAGAGDLDLDGHPDLIVGAPREDYESAGTNAGSASLFSGERGRLMYTFYGQPGQTEEMGWAVDGGVDFDRDGRVDVMVGVPALDHPGGRPESGAVMVFAGNDFYLRSDPHHVLAGDSFTLKTGEGEPFYPVLLFLATVDGAPLYRPITLSFLDGAGHWWFHATIPLSMWVPYDLGFQMLTIDSAGKTIDSAIHVLGVN